MEKLTVTNFLVIKNAEFDVGKINIIIGHQANGKSVLAKLLYFFREFLNSTYINSIKSFDNKRTVAKKGLQDFENYFPKYTWIDQEFNIIYTINDSEISIKKQKSKSGESSLKLDYSQKLISLHRKIKHSYKKKLDERVEKDGVEYPPGFRDPFREIIESYIYQTELSTTFNRSLFIPASRSFFANLQKNVFSFLASNIEIDPFIREFGSQYETAKRYYNRSMIPRRNSRESLRKKVSRLVETILVGKYSYEEEKDWILSKSKRTNLANASSGQQEALPMLLILSIWPFLGFGREKHMFFIEEPEAHLFPISQKHIVSLIALIHKRLNHSFVITTHSPYILTAINNLILVNDIQPTVHPSVFNKEFDEDYAIDYNVVRAYTFANGELISILDDDARLIGESVIDSVSDQFEREFDKLLNLQAEGLG